MKTWLSVCFALTLLAPLAAQPSSPQQAVDELLAADRAFAAAGMTKANVIDALTPMLAADVIMPLPGGRFAHGVDEVTVALKANPDNTTAKAEWSPVRGGISADATQGFTFGYMTIHRADGSIVPAKYMTYWVKGANGWRAVAYKRARCPEGPHSPMMPASLPDALVKPASTDASSLAAQLASAEKAFSDDAQEVGLGPAFVKHGASDAANMGAEAAFLVGNDKIGAFVGAGAPSPKSPLHWTADERAIVASSGDLGVSIGFIRQNAPAADGAMPPPSAFFTIWRKVNGVWKYIAE